MKKIIILAIINILLSFQTTVAQLGLSKSIIIAEMGKPDTLGVSDRDEFIVYHSTRTNHKTNNIYNEFLTYYFKKNESGREICYYIQKALPSTEIDFIVSDLNKNFVKIESVLWKDYKQNVIYKVLIDGKFCVITYMKDN